MAVTPTESCAAQCFRASAKPKSRQSANLVASLNRIEPCSCCCTVASLFAFSRRRESVSYIETLPRWYITVTNVTPPIVSVEKDTIHSHSGSRCSLVPQVCLAWSLDLNVRFLTSMFLTTKFCRHLSAGNVSQYILVSLY